MDEEDVGEQLAAVNRVIAMVESEMGEIRDREEADRWRMDDLGHYLGWLSDKKERLLAAGVLSESI